MDLAKAKETAKKINGQTLPVSYRNVWGFFSGIDSDLPDVLISKDEGCAPRHSVFCYDHNLDVFNDYETGEEVAIHEVFGKSFYDDDPSLWLDPNGGSCPVSERIDQLFDELNELLGSRGVEPVMTVMLGDSVDTESNDEDLVCRRLILLTNYLKKDSFAISTKEFAYIAQELLFIE